MYNNQEKWVTLEPRIKYHINKERGEDIGLSGESDF